jgi:hypothetical protein
MTTMRLPGESKFYSSVCHRYASGAVVTTELVNNRLNWLQQVEAACKTKANQVSACKINQFRDKGKCKVCLPGYICPGKYTLAVRLVFIGIN